jgi:16S rRNA (uracil1498-N3)-methyltransferase
VAVGPEGGFTEDEVGAAEQCQLVSLGPRILRVETAAITMAAALGTRQRSQSVDRP